jgi:DNA-3-methyladenine glycosylase II
MKRATAVPSYWNEACKALAKQDPVLKQLIEEYSDARLRSRGSAFETLLRAIVGQQISVKAAQAVWSRFEDKVGVVTVEAVLAQGPAALRSCGLSRQKVDYIRDLARHFESGVINPRQFRSLDDEELIKRLCDVRGIGRWTAEMFLIFHLRRPDIYPLQDIGLIRAVEKHYLGGQRASKDEVVAAGEPWRPWRTVATWYLWRSLDPFPVEY